MIIQILAVNLVIASENYHLQRHLNQLRKEILIFGIKANILEKQLSVTERLDTDTTEKELEHLEKGPYFTGVNCVMAISSFSLRLYSPTSTSKNIEVALRFATNKGMIVQFDRTGHYAAFALANFDCSWISRYPDENERIFMGGFTKLRVESVRIIDTHKNYQNIIKILFVFDSLLSGVIVEKDHIELTNKDKDFILMLIQNKHHNLSSLEADPYVISMIKSYFRLKRHITIFMYALCNSVLRVGIERENVW